MPDLIRVSAQADASGKLEPVLDHPHSNIILRSCDFHEFRVPSLYIIDNSPVLIKSIQSPSNPSGPDNVVSIGTDASSSLPVVPLSDSGDILSSLLSFIIPTTPHLPPSTEKTMELLSAAQKYEMSLVLNRIRDHIAQQDPPLVREETAFDVYSLANRHGLRQEAHQAARLTLKFRMSLSLEDLESKLDILSGSALHQLWVYHRSVQDFLGQDLTTFRIVGIEPRINFRCIKLTSSDVPVWLDDYIDSVARNPATFNLSEFHMALARHVTSCGDPDRRLQSCQTCASISRKTIDTFWTTFTTIFQRCIEEAYAEADLLSETDTRPKSRLENSMTNLFPPRCLDTNDADVIILSSDLARFRVHKSILSMSSPFFRDMFSLPQPPDGERIDGLPLLHLPEDAEILHSLVTMLYPIPSEIPYSYDKALALLSALQKYDMAAVQSSVRAVMKSNDLRPLTGPDTFRAYGIASAEGLSLEMETAARLTLDCPMTFEYMGDALSSFRGWALRDLVRFRRRCRDSLVSCVESLLDLRLPPSDVWVGCYNPMSFSIAPWLHTLLSDCIKELQQTFMNSLLKPSGLRDRYLSALRVHITQTNCNFCLRVHIMHGETFCIEIENKLATALDQIPFNLDSSHTTPNQQGQG